MTDTQIAKKKVTCPTERCFGFGMYKVPERSTTKYEVAISAAGLRIGYGTTPCPACGANANPNGRAE